MARQLRKTKMLPVTGNIQSDAVGVKKKLIERSPLLIFSVASAYFCRLCIRSKAEAISGAEGGRHQVPFGSFLTAERPNLTADPIRIIRGGRQAPSRVSELEIIKKFSWGVCCDGFHVLTISSPNGLYGKTEDALADTFAYPNLRMNYNQKIERCQQAALRILEGYQFSPPQARKDRLRLTFCIVRDSAGT